MNKKTIFISVMKLIIAGFLAKVLSTIAKLVVTRKIGIEATSIYSLCIPTMVLIINIAQLGLPTALTKLIAQNRNKTGKIMMATIFISIFVNLVIGVSYFLLVPTIANKLLVNPQTIPTLYCVGLLIPLDSFSGILKGYFMGIEKVEKASYCQISEELSRIIFTIVFIGFFNHSSASYLSLFAMIGIIVSEIASIIHLLISLNMNFYKKAKTVKKIDPEIKFYQKKILSVALPTTSTRIIGSITYFIEPILFTFLLLRQNYSSAEITQTYGIISGYVMPILLLPGFFATAFSMILLPLLSKEIAKANFKKAKQLLVYLTLASFSIGLVFSAFLSFKPEFIMQLLYKQTLGYKYVKKYAFLIAIYYIQAPLNSAMIALSLEKNIFVDSLICNIFRIVLYISLIPIFYGNGLIYAIIISVYLSVFINLFLIIKKFKSFKSIKQ